MAEEQKEETVDPSANDPKAAEGLNRALSPPSECKSPNEVLRQANEAGAVIPNYTALEIATVNFKKNIYNSFFLEGDTEKIHSTDVIKQYNDFMGKLCQQLLNYVDTGTLNVAISDDFKGQLDTAIADPSIKGRVKDFITLHFHCFKLCMTDNCLSMD